MNNASLIRLLLLAAIWGASFMFLRIAAPVLGPMLLIEWRVGLAALFLFAIALWRKKALRPRTHWKHYLFLGFFNSALTVTFLIPVFGVFWGVLFLGESIGWHTVIGSIVVIAGTVFATGYSLKAAFAGRAAGGNVSVRP